jgi:polysaccharide deacetylase 2 family uncharacterized protein YibQ
MIDDLDRPLGMDREPPRSRSNARLWVGLCVALALGCVAAFILLDRSRAIGGEPEAVATIQPPPPKPVEPVTAPLAPKAASKDDSASPAGKIETESGVIVIRGGGSTAPSAHVIQVPDSAMAQPLSVAPDHRLVEKSRYGLLPRRGKDGASPSVIYARPLAMGAQIKPGTPRIAIVVGGMGLNRAVTEEAIRDLPPAISLAFAPYGGDVAAQAAAARDAGHEILLQAPLEPFNSADSPGPHVLTTGDAAKAAEDLHWQMGRFSGYIGLVNFLGGRFTADRAASTALMAELADRGLDYVDDGSSPQSLAGDAASEKGVGFVKADLRLDESKKPEAVDSALFRLEELARKNGVAVGFAAGLPEANGRIARFANDLGKRGIALVPVSAALAAKTPVQGENR